LTLGFPDASIALAEFLEHQAEQSHTLATRLRTAAEKSRYRTYTPEEACALLRVRALSRAAQHMALKRLAKGKGWYRKLRRGVWIVDAAGLDKAISSAPAASQGGAR